MQSIYEDSVQLKEGFDGADGVQSLAVIIGGPHAIELLIHLPVGYPSTDAPIAEVYESFGLSNSQREEIVADLVRRLLTVYA